MQEDLRGRLARIITLTAASIGLGVTASYSFLLFHSLAEIFSVIVACGVFLVVWNSRRFQSNNYLTFLGPAFLFVALLDLLHTLAYRGMGVFDGYDTNLPTQLWVAARYLHCTSFLIAALFIHRRPNVPAVLVGYGTACCLLLLLIFRWPVFPACYVEGFGLTAFKKGSEYAICFVLLCSMAVLWRKRLSFDRDVRFWLMMSIGLTVGSELAFTLYTDPYGVFNGLGHWLKLLAFYFVYRAIIETGLARPYDLLFWDLKQSEEQLQHAKGVAEAASQAKDHFLAVLSHELRNPLNPVLLAASALKQDPAIRGRSAEDVETIHRNVELEARLIDDLLDLTRVSRGKLELRRENVDAHMLVAHAVKICCSDPAEARRHDLALELRAVKSIVSADPARLQQVFWNLLNNAMKFTPVGGSIRVRSRNLPERLRVEVIDSGIGIAPEVMSKLFAAFEQGDPTITQRFGGLGLGLSISKTIVDMLGGTLAAHSEGAGRGATFTIELPLASPQAQPSDESAQLPDLAARQPQTAALRLLLVEDHADTAQLMSRLLQSIGHGVSVAAGMDSALNLAQRQRFDLVLSDLGLPDGTGLELMRQLKSRYGLRGIALSGYGMEDDVRRSHEAGFDEHLTKPIDLSRLEAAIRRIAAT